MNVKLIGVQASACWSGQIHSIFDNAVNIFAGSLLTILYDERWASETNIILAAPMDISKDSFVLSDGHCLYIDGEKVADFSNSRRWQMPKLNYTALKLTALGNYLQHTACTVDTIFTDATKTWDFSKVIGAGAGLTPSGDDMLVGYALALLYTQPNRLQSLANSCIPLLSRTTDISRHFLIQAFDGKFTAPLVNLLLALQSGQNIDAAIATASSIGASSGRDGIFGLYCRLSSFCEGS